MKFLGVELDVLKLSIRNTANTFKSTFSSTATSDRIITLQDKNYTLADHADLVDASTSIRGFINTTTQIFGGLKKFPSGISANISGGYHSESFGDGATATGYGSTAIGGGAIASVAFSTAMGTDSIASSNYSIAIGSNASASAGAAFAMGHTASALAYGAIAMGFGSSSAYFGSIAIGISAATTKSNQVVIGASGLGYDIRELVVGMGESNAGAAVYGGLTFKSSNGSGTDSSGAPLRILAGLATGNALPGSLKLQSGLQSATSGSALCSIYTIFETAGNKWAFSQNSTIAPSVTQTGWSTTGTATNRTLTNTSSTTDVLNVLATLINDLKTKGIILS